MRQRTSAQRKQIEAEYQARREAALRAARVWRLNECGRCGEPGHLTDACSN